MGNALTLGSLFDGSGGFPLGGLLSGITPVWASEVEPFPIRVTTKRLPQIKHYGDVSKINGVEVTPVDIITFGSPCQDLSVAGKRAGLENGERSSLFYQAIRIVKEMRCATSGKYPRYIVWENVPGAFSSNSGEDFRAVLQAVCSVKNNDISVPQPENGKWTNAGEIVGNGFSLAWRVLDAQYWGVPQRRKRIYLVADFDGECAGKILFESESVSGYSPKSVCPWKGTATDVEDSTGTAGISEVTAKSAGFCTEHSAKSRGIGYEEETSPTLRAGVVPATARFVFENHSQDSRYTGPLDTSQTVSATYGMGGNNQPFVVETPKTLKVRCGCDGSGKGALVQDNLSATLSCNNEQAVFVPFVKGTRPHSADECEKWNRGETANTLNTFEVGERRCNELAVKAYGICSKDSNSMKSDNPNSGFYEAETSRTLDCNVGNPGCNQGGIAVVCVDQGGGKSSCNVTSEQSPTLTCTHGGEPVVALQGSMIGRADKNGPQGDGINEDVSFTLNTVDKHVVAYSMTTGCFMQTNENKSPTLAARDYKDPPTVCFSEESYSTYKRNEVSSTLKASGGCYGGGSESLNMDCEYIVRRLTPTECARLQGFPDWWCAELETENPTEEDIAFWAEVFETHRKITGNSSKPKSRSQIVKWLQNPHSDSAEYKMWGNGLCLNNAYMILSGIKWAAEQNFS